MWQTDSDAAQGIQWYLGLLSTSPKALNCVVTVVLMSYLSPTISNDRQEKHYLVFRWDHSMIGRTHSPISQMEASSTM
jgi:hypothetical protein